MLSTCRTNFARVMNSVLYISTSTRWAVEPYPGGVSLEDSRDVHEAEVHNLILKQVQDWQRLVENCFSGAFHGH